MYKVKGGEAFHLIALKTPICGIVNLFEIGLISIILALLFLFVFSIIVTSTYILVGQWYRGCHVRLYPPVLIRKEIRVFSQFKHLS